MGMVEDEEMLKREITAYEKRMLQTKTDTCKKSGRYAIAEFIGSIFFMFFNGGMMMALAKAREANMSTIDDKEIERYKGGEQYMLTGALGMGMGYAILHFMFAHISGGHMNSTITLSLLPIRKVSIARAGTFVMAHLVGCFIGGLFLFALAADIRIVQGGEVDDWRRAWQGFPAQGACYNANYINTELTGVDVGQSFLLEFMGGFMLLIAFNASTDITRSNQAAASMMIGMTYFIYALLAIPLNGGSLNPMKSVAAAVFASTVDPIGQKDPLDMCSSLIFSQLWVFVIGPILGGVLGSFTYEKLFSEDKTIKAQIDLSKYQPKGAQNPDDAA